MQSETLTDEALIAEALRRVTAESSTWLRADVARHLSNLIPAGASASATETVGMIDALADLVMKRCVPVGPTLDGPTRNDGRSVREAVTDRLHTADEILREEVRLQRWAEASASPPDEHLDPDDAAVTAVAGHDPLVVVVGPAGTGKTTVTARAVQTLHSQRRPVVGLAPSGKAADVLATEARCPTDTLAGFLARHCTGTSTWPTGTTVLLDEAGMAATDDYHGLYQNWEQDPANRPYECSARVPNLDVGLEYTTNKMSTQTYTLGLSAGAGPSLTARTTLSVSEAQAVGTSLKWNVTDPVALSLGQNAGPEYIIFVPFLLTEEEGAGSCPPANPGLSYTSIKGEPIFKIDPPDMAG